MSGSDYGIFPGDRPMGDGWQDPPTLLHISRISRRDLSDEGVAAIMSILDGETPEEWQAKHPGGGPPTPEPEENQDQTAT